MDAESGRDGAATLASEKSTVQPKASDPLDPMIWELPVVCKDCDKEFKVPYRHFQAGVVFHCRHCHGSYVPTLPMYRKVHDTFEAFFARMRRERDELTSAGNEHSYNERLERQLTEFEDRLKQLARQLQPA